MKLRAPADRHREGVNHLNEDHDVDVLSLFDPHLVGIGTILL